MTRYEIAKQEAFSIIERMTDRYHPELRDVNLKVDCMFAFATTDDNGDITGAAVKLNGYKCDAMVRVINLRDRTAGQGDAQIIIDGDNWDTWTDAQREALIDHELTHLELRTDKDGLVIRDDLDRPKLRLRKHDHQFGWFDSIARRHGGASIEIRQWNQFQEEHRQLWLKFEDDPDTTPVVIATPENDEELDEIVEEAKSRKKKGRELAGAK